MLWKGSNVVTNGDLISAIGKIVTLEEAQEFLTLAMAENPHAKANIGYLAGYFDNEQKHRIFDLFGVEHPIFGKLDPTFSQAMASGVAHGIALEQGKTYEEAKKYAHEICALPEKEVKEWLTKNCWS